MKKQYIKQTKQQRHKDHINTNRENSSRSAQARGHDGQRHPPRHLDQRQPLSLYLSLYDLYIYIYIYICIRVQVYVHAYVYVCVYILTCHIHIYIYIYIYLHITEDGLNLHPFLFCCAHEQARMSGGGRLI